MRALGGVYIGTFETNPWGFVVQLRKLRLCISALRSAGSGGVNAPLSSIAGAQVDQWPDLFGELVASGGLVERVAVAGFFGDGREEVERVEQQVGVGRVVEGDECGHGGLVV